MRTWYLITNIGKGDGNRSDADHLRVQRCSPVAVSDEVPRSLRGRQVRRCGLSGSDREEEADGGGDG